MGKLIDTASNYDTNLFWKIITSHSATGTLHFMNKIQTGWFSKKKATIETEIYGIEYPSSRTCVQ